MERTTTCIPCVPSILEGFRRGGNSAGGVLKSGSGAGETGAEESDDNEGRENSNINQTKSYKGKPTFKVSHLGTESSVSSATATAISNSGGGGGGSVLPSLISLTGSGSSSTNKVYPLQKGKTSIGSSCHQDIVIDGIGVDDQHCYIINEGQVVTFYPLTALNSLDGFRVTKPTKLNHGSVLCFGHSVYFRFNQPQEQLKSAQKIVIKGDENRRQLIKQQSKPSGQDINHEKSNFPVPDESQFHWLDFDKELGLKPPSRGESKWSNRYNQSSQPAHNRGFWTLQEPHSQAPSGLFHTRPVRSSLPLSQSGDTPARKGRFLSQGIETYPRENSEFGPTSPTFLQSQPFSHEPKDSVKHLGKLPKCNSISNNKDKRHGDNDSDSGTQSTETSSLSSCSHSSGVKVSRVDGINQSHSPHDPKGPSQVSCCKLTVLPSKSQSRVVSSVSKSSSPSSGTVSHSLPPYATAGLCSASSGYDNIANIKAAIAAAAAAKLANCSKPIEFEGSRISGISSASGTSSVKAAECDVPVCSSEPLISSTVKSSVSENSSDTLQSVVDSHVKGASEVQSTFSDDCSKKSPEPGSSVSDVKSCILASEQSGVTKVVEESQENSRTETLPEHSSDFAVDKSTVEIEGIPSSTFNNSVVSSETKDYGDVVQADQSLSCLVQGDSVTNQLRPSVGSLEETGHQTVKENCVSEIKESDFVGELTADDAIKHGAVCSSKPPLGKPVQEANKTNKSDRKTLKPEKKTSESTATSLFKSLLSRSRSPSPKGRANRSPSPSSAQDSADSSRQRSSSSQTGKDSEEAAVVTDSNSLIQNSQAATGGCKDEKQIDENFMQKSVHQVKCRDDSEKSSQTRDIESLENPWRVNLKLSLRPNLENFKGEKVFTKDTVTTNLVIRQHGSQISTRASSVSNGDAVNDIGKAQLKISKGPISLSDSAHDLRTLNASEQRVSADIDFGYISDSGLTVGKDSGKVNKLSALGRTKGKKSVTFAEESEKPLSDQKDDSSSLSPVQQLLIKDMDRVVEGRSPTEKLSASENVRTFLEVIDSGWHKTRTEMDQTDLTTTRDKNGIAGNMRTKYADHDGEEENPKRFNSKSTDLFNKYSEFNNNSSGGGDGDQMKDNRMESLQDSEERYSISLDDADLEDLGASQQDLKMLYKQQRAERLEEQKRAAVEKQRLEEILKMCSQFGVQIMPEKAEGADDSKALTKLNTDYGMAFNSSSSNSEDDAEKGTIKRRPIQSKASPVSPPVFDSTMSFQLQNCLSDDHSITKCHQALEPDDLSPASPVVDSGIDISAIDRPYTSLHPSSVKDFGSLFLDRQSSGERRPSTERLLLDEECWPPSAGSRPRRLMGETEILSGKYSGGVKGLFQEVWNDEKTKQVQLDLLQELQRDVVQNIADIKQKIVDVETRQSEAVREVEMERALLEGEQQIQMEQLDRIKEKVISLEKKEASLLAEAASQRSKEVERICAEKKRLVELEDQLTLSKELASRTMKVDEAEILNNRCLEMQDAVDSQRFLVDNLEFQQLEAEAHYEEEKEIIQRELKAEREYLESLSSQHQATLKQIVSQQSDLLKQVDMDVFELEKERHLLAEQFRKENTVLYNINRQIQEALPSPMSDDSHQNEDVRITHSAMWHRPRLAETEIERGVRSSTGSPRKGPIKLSHTIPKVDPHRVRHGGDISDDEERRFIYELKMRSLSRPTWDKGSDLPDGGGVGTGALVPWQGSASAVGTAPNATSESEESSVSGSDPLSDKAISLSSKEDQLHDMECLLVLAKAEGLRLVEEQIHKRDIEREALEQERRRRKELERRLAQEIAKNNDVIEQAIRLREKEKLQARPLTRYLPVRDRSLDLLQFIVSAGHSVDQCAHLLMTSTSCRGYLTKMGSRIRTWKKRWFVFDRTKRCLSYYGDKSESRPRGVIYFQAIEDVFVDHLHQVKSPTPQLTFCVKTYDRMYYLVAPSPDAMRIWIDVIFTGAEGYQQFA